MFGQTILGGAALPLADDSDFHEWCEASVEWVLLAGEVELAGCELHARIVERRTERTDPDGRGFMGSILSLVRVFINNWARERRVQVPPPTPREPLFGRGFRRVRGLVGRDLEADPSSPPLEILPLIRRIQDSWIRFEMWFTDDMVSLE